MSGVHRALALPLVFARPLSHSFACSLSLILSLPSLSGLLPLIHSHSVSLSCAPLSRLGPLVSSTHSHWYPQLTPWYPQLTPSAAATAAAAAAAATAACRQCRAPRLNDDGEGDGAGGRGGVGRGGGRSGRETWCADAGRRCRHTSCCCGSLHDII